MTARVVNHSLASHRLLSRGYYDESLALTRSVGEVANLLFLFLLEPTCLSEWTSSSEDQRKRAFSPVKVRLRIEKLKASVPVDEERYSTLCEVGVHVTPATAPQNYNPTGRPTVGGIVQEIGLLAALNELATALAFAGLGLVKVFGYGERNQGLLNAVSRLLDSIGAVTLKDVPERLREFSRHRDSDASD
jgi:hypothetical protein